jgi:hypothetical protein
MIRFLMICEMVYTKQAVVEMAIKSGTLWLGREQLRFAITKPEVDELRLWLLGSNECES